MYATGTPTSIPDFLNSLATFAATAGWTVDHNGLFSSSDYWVAIHQGSTYLNYYMPPPVGGANTLIGMYGATGFSSGAGPTGQANTSIRTAMSPIPPGPFAAYHFFSTTAGPIYLHALLEVSTNVFLSMHGGALNAAGGASPATYVAATSWSTLSGGNGSSDAGPGSSNYTPFSGEENANGFALFQVYATVDGTAAWFWPGNAAPARAIGSVRSGSRNFNAVFRMPNTFNLLCPFIPISLYLERAAGGIFSYVGDVFDMRWTNITNNSPKDEVTIGADTWKLFPVIAKLPFGSPTAATGDYAFAFRKNA